MLYQIQHKSSINLQAFKMILRHDVKQQIRVQEFNKILIVLIMDALNPYEIQEKVPFQYNLHHTRKKRSQSFGAIFGLPRPILSHQPQAVYKTLEQPIKESPPKLNSSQSDFINNYRDNLRRTIFTQTKQMFKNNKKIMQKVSQSSLEQYKKILIQQGKSKSQSKEIKKTFSLYQTIICANPHKKKKQQLQLQVSRLPIIKKKTSQNQRKKIDRLIQHSINSYQINSPSRTNHIQFYGQSPKSSKKSKKEQKSQIIPWQTVQEFGL